MANVCTSGEGSLVALGRGAIRDGVATPTVDRTAQPSLGGIAAGVVLGTSAACVAVVDLRIKRTAATRG